MSPLHGERVEGQLQEGDLKDMYIPFKVTRV
jgi:hypothetical protein